MKTGKRYDRSMTELSSAMPVTKAAVVINVGAAAFHADGLIRVVGSSTGERVLTTRQAEALGREMLAWAEREKSRASARAAVKASAARRLVAPSNEQ